LHSPWRTGFSLGAGAIHGLHAAASPPAYVVNEITVTEDGYKKDFLPGDFLPGAQKAIDDNGGKYIAGGFNKSFSITGQPQRTASSFSSSRTWTKSRRGETPPAMRKRRSAASTRPSTGSQWKA
jgi:hypothetical protein